jgi:hypothetical protein
VRARIGSIGVVRSRALAQFICVRAVADATLDVMTLAGRAHVGLVPETLPSPGRAGPIRDALFGRKRKRRPKPPLAEIITAGDDDVCIVCQDLEDDNPYTIAEARGLIPAHPHCRCAWAPLGAANDSATVLLDWTEEEHPRDPNGEFASTGAPNWDKIKNPAARARAQEALRRWQSDHEQINAELREGEGDDWRTGPHAETITDLTNAVRGAGPTLKDDLVTWRGVGGMGVDAFPGVGGEFTDKGFTSLSTSKRVAAGFTTGLEGVERGDKALLKVTVEKGSHVVQTPGGAHGRVEKELLLNRGTRFKVTGVKGRVISVRALKQ